MNKVRKDAQYVKVKLEIELKRVENWNRNFRMNEQHRKYIHLKKLVVV